MNEDLNDGEFRLCHERIDQGQNVLPPHLQDRKVFSEPPFPSSRAEFKTRDSSGIAIDRLITPGIHTVLGRDPS